MSRHSGASAQTGHPQLAQRLPVSGHTRRNHFTPRSAPCPSPVEVMAHWIDQVSSRVSFARRPLTRARGVADDGAGFDPQISPAGFGLINMTHRASELGGQVTWENTEPHACTMIAVFPIRRAQ